MADDAASRAASSVNVTLVKSFLEELKSLGDIRLIMNDGCAVRQLAEPWLVSPLLTPWPAQVLESVTTFDGLFYAQVPNKCVLSSRA